MINSEILNSIKKITDLSNSEIELILNKFETKIIKRKTNLLAAGKIAKEIYFITKGCLRLYYEKDGVDISAYFYTEGMFAGAYDSFISKQPSRHYIETLENSELLSVNFTNFTKLFDEFPKMNEFVRKILEDRFISLHKLFTSQILDSPQERYLSLFKNNPDLINRVPQHQIATFLGITPVSLSRIRNRIARK